MHLRHVLISILIIAAGALSVTAQSDISPSEDSESSSVAAPAPWTIDGPYTLKKGDNEFGIWAGGSFAATTAFGGLTDAEADDRKFFQVGLCYGRTLYSNDSVALQYHFDAIPIAVATGNLVNATFAGLPTVRRETSYGAGLTPLGLQLDFANGSRVHPFIHVNGGLLVFNKSMPLPDAGRLALVGETGGGVRIFTSDRRAVTLGAKFYHISNGDRSGSNRGLNHFVIYGGFSIFK
ncbi:MAG TPA: acyloxyacyl hydrolase [Pyrinomonadaceae bacterium]|nr:acyloxyacyl hydrolase [Pyrinomonadaceae bacterium]